MTDKRPRPGDLSRRELLASALVLPVLGAIGQRGPALLPTLPDIRKAPYRVVGGPGADALVVTRTWSNPTMTCKSRLANPTDRPVVVKEVVLFEVDLRLMPETALLYGEGFQMLSQTAGTVGAPVDAGSYTDAGHYKMPAAAGGWTFYGLMTMDPALSRVQDGVLAPSVAWVLAFTSCRRFSGLFRFRGAKPLEIVVDTEGLTLGPGESWQLEDYTQTGTPTGNPKWIADRLSENHPPAMGDWLETGAAFGGDVRAVLDQIKKKGFQPAIWVAPFIAEEASHVFQQHRDWFVMDTDGSPLRSDKVTFGGWRKGPWYVLDGTHPDVQAHFEKVFGTMRKEWGVTYFKLDANFWGAIHGGRFHDPKATRIEAYRRGMKAILRGAGDSFILGCNHPIWPSVGLIHGSRSSNDIKRTWDRIKTTAQQNLLRNWQNGRLWWNDPDAIVLTGELPENEFLFHATAIYATGGMLLSGDDLTAIPEPRLAMLKRLLPPTGVPAVFDDGNLRIGTVDLPGKQMFCCFNWADTPVTLNRRLYRPVRVTDFWTGESLGRMENRLTLEDMPPHSARLLECRDV